MNITIFLNLFSSLSLKELFKLIFFTFLGVLSLPLLVVVLTSNIGNQTVSDSLVSVNALNNQIEIHDPRSGEVTRVFTEPVTWPAQGTITLEFGESDLPYQPLHTGIDIANSRGIEGDPVKAFAKGKVTYVGDLSWGYGKHVIIDHGNSITSLYGHLRRIDVTSGQEVLLGQIIGREGSTGWSTGPHLHFETRVYGIPVNPRTFLYSH